IRGNAVTVGAWARGAALLGFRANCAHDPRKISPVSAGSGQVIPADPGVPASSGAPAPLPESNDGRISHDRSAPVEQPAQQSRIRLGRVSAMAAARLAEDPHAGDAFDDENSAPD